MLQIMEFIETPQIALEINSYSKKNLHNRFIKAISIWGIEAGN